MKRLLATTISLSVGVLALSPVQAQPRLEPQITGQQLVPSDVQRQFGLLRLSNPEGSCSASMLNDYWAITAAHCVYSEKTGAQFQPAQINLTAKWSSKTKTAQALKVVAYGDGKSAAYDIALLQTGLYDFTRPDMPSVILKSGPPSENFAVTSYGQGDYAPATGLGPSATQGQYDGKFRVAQFTLPGDSVPDNGTTFDLSANTGNSIAWGDSGGPALIQEWDDPYSSNRKLEWHLLGVTSRVQYACMPDKDCNKDKEWAISFGNATDAAIYPVRDNILQTIQQVPPPQQFTGVFGTTPKDFQAIFLYVIAENGTVQWYRKNSNTTVWQGPNVVAGQWQNFLDVIPAGRNNFYTINPDGALYWYQHNGFNFGQIDWFGPFLVGDGWNDFLKVFSGGDGILYAIQSDGTLLWYHNWGYNTGSANWEGPTVVGSGWDQFKDVFSMGQGIIYAVKQDGTLLWYNHTGYANGDATWAQTRIVGSAWDQFNKIIPTGSGVILAVRPNGDLFWYRHDNYQEGVSLTSNGSRLGSSLAPIWEGGIQIGSGFTGFRNIVAPLFPNSTQGPN